MTERLRHRFYRMVRGVLWIALVPLFRVRSFGSENVPAGGPVILVGNHRSNVDPLILGLGMSRTVAFMAKAELFEIPVLGTFLRVVYSFPVQRGASDRSALRRGAETLKAGRALGMFPEGSRQTGPGLGEAHAGAALLAMQTACPIVPAAILGTDHLWTMRARVPFPSRVEVRYGEPILADPKPEDRRAERDRLMEETMASIAQLGGFAR